MAQVPGSDGQFLATHKFYSPNDSMDAEIVIATPQGNGNWEIRTLCSAPFVHRFGILNRGGADYLIVCCLKTGHEHKDDWRFEGACYGAQLPGDLSSFDKAHPLKLTLLKGAMLKNHGYCTIRHGGMMLPLLPASRAHSCLTRRPCLAQTGKLPGFWIFRPAIPS